MGARWLWRRGVAVANLGQPPYEVDGVPVLRPLALLRDAGFEVHAVSRAESRPRSEVDGVTAWVEPTIRTVATRIAALRPELLFVESHTYGVALAPLARRSWVRNPVPAARPWTHRVQQAALRAFDVVSFTNPADKSSWTFNEKRHVDLAYPLDVKWWSTRVPRQDSWWTDRGRAVPAGPVLVCNAAYARRKRVCELLEMLAPFLAENPDCVIVFVGHQFGEPDVAARLAELPAKLGVAEQVMVTGWMSRDEVRDLLAWAAVAIINSSWETQCLAVYEALAAGVPTLISAIPVLTSQFPELPAHSGQRELRSNLERVLGDHVFAQSLVEAAAERVAWADVDRHDEVFDTALRRLLDNRGSR